MSCACCDEITRQMIEWRTGSIKNERELRYALDRATRLEGRVKEERASAERLFRRVNALRGALTKAKRRIAELKGGGA